MHNIIRVFGFFFEYLYVDEKDGVALRISFHYLTPLSLLC